MALAGASGKQDQPTRSGMRPCKPSKGGWIMSKMPAETQTYWSPGAAAPYEARGAATRPSSGGLPWGWLIAGAVVVGLGALAWSYLGPDLRRYLKIRNM